jgi:hypothetical protein
MQFYGIHLVRRRLGTSGCDSGCFTKNLDTVDWVRLAVPRIEMCHVNASTRLFHGRRGVLQDLYISEPAMD